MPARPEDRHFAAFRASGDPAALARVFDRTAPHLLHVALHLTGDRHAAEDLVQATFVAAIEDADGYRPDAAVRSWLLGILANRARDLRRRTRRRVDPARLADLAPSDPAVAAEGRELTEACAAALDALPEVYAAVLELHLAHGLSAKEIARVLRRPAGTVRTQVVRGMELLRRALPSGFALGAMVAVSGSGLAQVRRALLAHATSSAPAALVAGGLPGAIVMKKTLLIGAAGFCVAAVLWHGLPTSGSGASAPPLPDQAPERRVGLASSDAGADAGATEPTREPTAPPRSGMAPGSGGVRLRCVWSSDGAPVPLAAAWCYPKGFNSPFAQREADERGRVEFRDVPAGPCMFLACRNEARVTVVAGAVVDAELRVAEAALVSGTVVDAQRHPVAGAAVRHVAPWPATVAVSGPDGRFRARVATAGPIWAEKDGLQPSRPRAVELTGDARPVVLDEVVLVLEGAGHRIVGVVRDPLGRPVANAWVAVPVDAGPEPPRQALTMRTDALGRFATGSVPVGRPTVYARAPGFAFGFAEVDLQGGGAVEVAVELRRGAVVSGLLQGRDGKTRPKTHVLCHTELVLPGLGRLLSDVFTRTESTADAAGRFRLQGLQPGRVWLAALTYPQPVNHHVALADGQAVEWNPQIGPPGALALGGTLVDPEQRPLLGWQVSTQHLDLATRSPELSRARSDADGRFVLRDLRDLPYSVRVSTPEGHLAAVRELRPGLPEVVWEIPFRLADCGSVAGRLLDAAGGSVAEARIQAVRDGITRGAALVDGAFRLEQLPPGTWALRAWRTGEGSFELGTAVVAPGAETTVGTLRLPAPGRLVVRIAAAEVRGVGARLTQLDGGRNNTTRFEVHGGELRAPPLPPGRYRLQVFGAEIAPIDRAVRIPSGDTAVIEEPTAPGVPVRITFVPEELTGDEWTDRLAIRLLDAGGQEVVDHGVRVAGSASHTFAVALRPGEYRVEGSSVELCSRRGQAGFAVPARGAAPVTVEVRLAVLR